MEQQQTMAKNPATIDYAALVKQRAALDAKINELRAETMEAFKQKIMEEARELEIDVHQLFGPQHKTRGGKGGNAVAKYRDPKNSANTWSGRGRPAKWLADYIESGKDKDDFLIK